MHDTEVYDLLVGFAESIGLKVVNAPFKHVDALIMGMDIGISDKLPEDKRPAVLGHELGHYVLHDGNLIDHPDPDKELQADRVGNLLVQFAKYQLQRMTED